MTIYIHKNTLAEFSVVTAGPKVIVLKCIKEGSSAAIKIGSTTKTSPAGLLVLYSQK